MIVSDPGQRRARLWVALIFVGVFGAGTAFGLGLAHLGGGPPDDLRESPADRLTRVLGLDASQRQKLDMLAERSRPVIEALLRETEPRIRALRDGVENDLRPFLSADQLRRLDALQARRPPPGAPDPSGRHGPGGPPPHPDGPPPPPM